MTKSVMYGVISFTSQTLTKRINTFALDVKGTNRYCALTPN